MDKIIQKEVDFVKLFVSLSQKKAKQVWTMKHIKVFLASSEELTDDRNAFGNLVRRLDKIYEVRGVRIELFEWEDYDAAYNRRRKQDEYNDQIKASDMFLALFHTKAGKFTIEEFDVATEEFRKHASPKVYVYCKDIQPDEQASPELIEFKRKLFDEMGHYWSRYQNRDSMQLHFVMQLQLVETSGVVENLKVEKGLIVLEDMPIAKLDHLQFAAGNAAYQQMSKELTELPEKIEQARKRADKYPDDDDLQDELQQKLNRYNRLKDEFAQLQKALFETARRITMIQQERVSDMLRRAIEAFEEGKIERANVLLDEIAQEAEHHILQLDLQRELVHRDIDAFLLQARTVIADASIPIDVRIKKASAIYAKANEWAEKSAYDPRKYDELLTEHYRFLSKYGHYKEALDILQREKVLTTKLYGEDSEDVADSYRAAGSIFYDLGEYQQALESYEKALTISQTHNNEEKLSSIYNDMAIVFGRQCHYQKALEYYKKAILLNEAIHGKEDLSTAILYSNIASLYQELDQSEEARTYLQNAARIMKEHLDENHLDMAWLYIQEADTIYDTSGPVDQVLAYYQKALSIRQRELGTLHPLTASVINLIGSAYDDKGDTEKALDYQRRALDIYRKVYGEDSDRTATIYQSIGNSLITQGQYKEANRTLMKALEICKNIWGEDHLDLAHIYGSLLTSSLALGDYDAALFYGLNAKELIKKHLRIDHRQVANINSGIAGAFLAKGKYDEALTYAHMALIDGRDSDDTLLLAVTWELIGNIHYKLEHYEDSLAAFEQCLPLMVHSLGEEHTNVAQVYVGMGNDYVKIGCYDKALSFLQQALDIAKKSLDESHLYFSGIYAGIARTYKGLGKESLWAKYLNMAVDQAIGSIGEEHPYTKELMREMFFQDCPFIVDVHSCQ